MPGCLPIRGADAALQPPGAICSLIPGVLAPSVSGGSARLRAGPIGHEVITTRRDCARQIEGVCRRDGPGTAPWRVIGADPADLRCELAPWAGYVVVSRLPAPMTGCARVYHLAEHWSRR
jgi:hypothetical protein